MAPSPDKQADEKATQDLKRAHAQEFDELRRQHAEQLKAQQQKQGGS